MVPPNLYGIKIITGVLMGCDDDWIVIIDIEFYGGLVVGESRDVLLRVVSAGIPKHVDGRGHHIVTIVGAAVFISAQIAR